MRYRYPATALLDELHCCPWLVLHNNTGAVRHTGTLVRPVAGDPHNHYDRHCHYHHHHCYYPYYPLLRPPIRCNSRLMRKWINTGEQFRERTYYSTAHPVANALQEMIVPVHGDDPRKYPAQDQRCRDQINHRH
eukprot:gene3809-biopygen8962